VIVQYPEHPQGYYFKASSFFYQIISGYADAGYKDRLDELNERTIAVAEQFEESDPAIGQFYQGTAYGNKARYHAMNGDLIQAFYYARKSKNLHEDVLAARPDIYDAYLTVGVYNYYSAAIPRWMDAVAGLFGLGGNRELGIQQIETAYKKGNLAGVEAKFFLANVYYEEGDYERSFKFYKELSSDFKNNTFLINQLGFLHYSMEQFRDAEIIFKETLSKIDTHYLSSKMFAQYFLGRIHKLKNDYPSALRYLSDAAETGKTIRLFKSIDAWIVGAAYYQAGEVMELTGDRSAAVRMYERARNHELSGKGTVQASKNRLQHGLSPFEIDVIRARHLILYGETAEGLRRMEQLKPLAMNGNEKFLSQIDYYIGRASCVNSDFVKAKIHFQEALKNPSDDGDQKWREPQARYFLGECYARLNQPKEARDELTKVLDYDQYLEAPRYKFLARKLLNEL
jgi:tetratricopeptide (TPR) repeat protein